MHLIHLLLLINLHLNSIYKYVLNDSPNSVEQNIKPMIAKSGLQEQYTKQITKLSTEGSWLHQERRVNLSLEEIIRLKFKTSSSWRVHDSDKKNINVSTYHGFTESIHSVASYFVLMKNRMCQNGEKRGEFRTILSRYLDSDVSGIVEGFLLGGSANLEKPILQAVKVAGVSHILSASGSNVSLFLLIHSPVFWRFFGKHFTAFLGVVLLFWYLQIAGCSPPLVRAVVSAVLTLTAGMVFVQHSALRVLGLTCLCIFLMSSNYITSIGFQLSVAATLGIILFTRVNPNKNSDQSDLSKYYIHSKHYHSKSKTANVQHAFYFCEVITKHLISSCKSVLRTTLAAQIFTLPIILLYFGELSTIAIVSNVLLLWLVPLVVTTSIITVIFGALSLHSFAILVGTLTTFFTRTFLVILQAVGQHESLLIHFTSEQAKWTVFAYAMLLIVLFHSKKKNSNVDKTGSSPVCFKKFFCQC